MKNMLMIIALVIAFATWAIAAPARGVPVTGSSAVKSEKTATVGTVAAVNTVESTPSVTAEDVISLAGRSTYALSRVENTYSPVNDTGIDRERPATRPPDN